MRKSYAESVLELERLGLLEQGQAPPSPPAQRPQFDDDTPGVHFFRARVYDCDLSSLTLPGTYVGRSSILRSSFRSSDLRMSTMCWNDFTDVDFSGACLADCDLRGSVFARCRFTDADVSRALLGRDQALDLSDEQRAAIAWCDDEPPGG